MIPLGEIVCQKCSGKLVKKGWYALCTKCGAKWIIESHANGSFKAIRRVDGQMSEENDNEAESYRGADPNHDGSEDWIDHISDYDDDDDFDLVEGEGG